MLNSSISGDEQIKALTGLRTLPLDAVPKSIILVIVELVGKAWVHMRRVVPGVSQAAENNITLRLQTELINFIEADPLLNDLVSTIVRSPDVPNFDGTKIGKRPDLAIYFRYRSLHFPLSIECKVIHHLERKSIDLYGHEGIRRFVAGEYAWASREAVMLAYVKDASSLSKDFMTWLDQPSCPYPRNIGEVEIVGGEQNDLSFAMTNHERLFRYRESAGSNLPGPIAIWHLWLDAA